MSKLGRAACSILTLGCVCLRGFSVPAGDDCPWDGNLALGGVNLLSKPKSSESVTVLVLGVCVVNEA